MQRVSPQVRKLQNPIDSPVRHAAFIMLGITLHVPETDWKGRIDMSQAVLSFDPGPPPPVVRSPITARTLQTTELETSAAAEGRRMVLWRGLRRCSGHALLLAFFRDVSDLLVPHVIVTCRLV